MDLIFAPLKSRQRAIRESFPDLLDLRVHRAISWLQRYPEHELPGTGHYSDHDGQRERVVGRTLLPGGVMR